MAVLSAERSTCRSRAPLARTLRWRARVAGKPGDAELVPHPDRLQPSHGDIGPAGPAFGLQVLSHPMPLLIATMSKTRSICDGPWVTHTG